MRVVTQQVKQNLVLDYDLMLRTGTMVAGRLRPPLTVRKDYGTYRRATPVR